MIITAFLVLTTPSMLTLYAHHTDVKKKVWESPSCGAHGVFLTSIVMRSPGQDRADPLSPGCCWDGPSQDREDPGAMVVEGHVSGWGRDGVSGFGGSEGACGLETAEGVSPSRPRPEMGWGRQEVGSVSGASERDHSSDELNSKFRSQRLHSSSSSNETAPPSPPATPAPTPKSPKASPPSPLSPSLPLVPLALPSGTSMTLPKVRTPLTPRDSIQLVKKHHSQPQPGFEKLHHVNVSIDIAAPPDPLRPAPPGPQRVEETDIDEVPDAMEVVEGAEVGGGASRDPVSLIGLPEELEFLDPDVLKPPTPPLHRFPSWVRERGGE